MRSPDVLVARLEGARSGTVAVVRRGGRHYFVAPARMGGARPVPGGSLTDALHGAVEEMSAALPPARRRKGGGAR